MWISAPKVCSAGRGWAGGRSRRSGGPNREEQPMLSGQLGEAPAVVQTPHDPLGPTVASAHVASRSPLARA